jgi:hypothetical protein
MMNRLALALVALLPGGCHAPFDKSVTVNVALTEGKLSADTHTVQPANRIIFEVTNSTDKPHHFVVAETDFPPEKLPVQDGRVRYYTYSDEPHRLWFREDGGWSQQAPRGTSSTLEPCRREPGVKVPPGQTIVYREVYAYDLFRSGRAFVLFCNESGHYEQGEYAALVVK